MGERNGGETGIRPLDTLRYTRFPSVRLQPLGHLSAVWRTSMNLSQRQEQNSTTGLAQDPLQVKVLNQPSPVPRLGPIPQAWPKKTGSTSECVRQSENDGVPSPPHATGQTTQVRLRFRFFSASLPNRMLPRRRYLPARRSRLPKVHREHSARSGSIQTPRS